MSIIADASGAEDHSSQARAAPGAHWRRRVLPYALALPIVLYEIALIVYPIAQGIYRSFQQIDLAANSTPTWVGLANYRRMLGDPEFWQVMRITLIFTAVLAIARDQASAGRMSAIVQGLGYGVAAVAPTFVGWVHASTGSWTPPLLVVLGSVLAFGVGTLVGLKMADRHRGR